MPPVLRRTRVDGRNFAPKKPYGESRVNTNKQWLQPWFQRGAKWISSIHSMLTVKHHVQSLYPETTSGSFKVNQLWRMGSKLLPAPIHMEPFDVREGPGSTCQFHVNCGRVINPQAGVACPLSQRKAFQRKPGPFHVRTISLSEGPGPCQVPC